MGKLIKAEDNQVSVAQGNTIAEYKKTLMLNFTSLLKAGSGLLRGNGVGTTGYVKEGRKFNRKAQRGTNPSIESDEQHLHNSWIEIDIYTYLTLTPHTNI